MARLALQFGLSLQTAAIRLERAGAISSNKKTALVRRGHVGHQAGSFDNFKQLRLRDEIEDLCTADGYPRAPFPTVCYAERALEDGFIGDEEFAAIVPQRAAMPDIAAWFA